MKTFLIVVALLVLAGGGYLWLAPGPVNAAAWQPPEPPAMTGVLTPNQALEEAELLAVGQVYGPEDVDVDAEGRVYAGTQDGKILRVLEDGSVESFAITGGRPLGMEFDASGNLIVADAFKGLLSIDPQGDIKVLLTEVEGEPFGFTDDLDIAADGVIYFSDASTKFDQSEYVFDLLEMRPYGRLIAFDPATGVARVLMRDLYFANGIALSQKEDFVLVNETWKYRVHRYWLDGDKAGTHEVFIDNLPGFPDGISGNRQGTFWLALITPRLADVDDMHTKPWLKNIVAKLPAWMRPKAVQYGLVLALDEQGRIVASYHDADGQHLREITSVEEHEGYIYLGSLHNDRIGKLRLRNP